MQAERFPQLAVRITALVANVLRFGFGLPSRLSVSVQLRSRGFSSSAPLSVPLGATRWQIFLVFWGEFWFPAFHAATPSLLRGFSSTLSLHTTSAT